MCYNFTVDFNMKERSIEKFFMLPFSLVCGSDSSVSVCQHEKTKTNPPEKTKGEESSSSVKMKSFWAMTRPRFSQNVQRLKRHFKGFSQLFVGLLDSKMQRKPKCSYSWAKHKPELAQYLKSIQSKFQS
ncbi:hypothetical protein HAX54_026016 [Datura stramonium]|uniref:Uncharacterized protein n=1 Tax=Datura stramonium TaxID=4076 RepID=A0ABS8V0F3_DATST|nr:hypothetical protein [Datura stramonium]